MESSKVESQESFRPNLIAHFAETMDAIDHIEQGGWLGSELRELGKPERKGSQGSVKSALAYWRSLEAENALQEMPNDKSVATIYGDGGVTRYFLMPDGSIEFSRFHASSEKLERAQQRGFKIRD